jgi:hypothetical protein
VRKKTVAIDPTDPTSSQVARLRRVRRVALVIGGALSVLFVLGLRHCLEK